MRAPRTCALLLFLCSPLLAQTDTAGLRIKAESRLVLADEVVTGKKDEPIHGLTAKDFHVFEDGKEQVITGFQTHSGPAVPGMSQQQHFVLLLDARYDQGIDLKWVQLAALKFIEDNIGPNRLMSVAYYGAGCTPTVTVAVQFTDDVGQLRHALEAWPGLDCRPPFHDRDGQVRAWAYAQLAKDLGHVPGHKAVVLFAGGVPAPIADAGVATAPAARSIRQLEYQNEQSAEARRDPFGMALEFRKANVSVYPAGGTANAQNPVWALYLADATGGHELFRGNDAVAVFDAIAREQNESYTLAYVPEESREGSCHELKVTVDRPDGKVRGRNLYCNITEMSLPSANKMEAELENLAASPHAGNTTASASMPFFYEPGGAARVNLALEVPAPVLDPIEANGKLQVTMDVLGLVYNLGGSVAARFGDTVRFDFDDRQQFDSFVQHPLRYEHQFGVAPGNYRFKLIFRTAKDRFGVVETALTVDPFDDGQLGLSAIDSPPAESLTVSWTALSPGGTIEKATRIAERNSRLWP
ncbi:MAG: VWA domain-containing protein [Bryobacteraceae bacterium]